MYSRTLVTAVLGAVLLASVILPTSCTSLSDESMTTSPALGIATSTGRATLKDFGEAVISYLGGKNDLGTVQALVAPSAHDGLAQMLSVLERPTRFRVMGAGVIGDATRVDNDVLFLGGGSEPAEFTLTVAVDLQSSSVTIVAIQPGRIGLFASATTTSSLPITTILDNGKDASSLPIIQLQDQPDLQYLSPRDLLHHRRCRRPDHGHRGASPARQPARRVAGHRWAE